MSSRQPRKQRKRDYEAPLHERQDELAATLSDSLRERYGTRRVNLRTGDTVEVMRGDNAGETGDVEEIDLDSKTVIVEDVTVQKSDGSTETLPLDPSNLRITSLDTSDPERERKLEA